MIAELLREINKRILPISCAIKPDTTFLNDPYVFVRIIPAYIFDGSFLLTHNPALPILVTPEATSCQNREVLCQ